MGKTSILIVEDECIVAADIQRHLTKSGYAVPGVVSSAEEAVRIATEQHPDLVLMDIVLAGEMDGIEAAGQIRSRLNIPVVFLTAYRDQETLERAKITEPFGYLTKPFDITELNITIEMALYKNEMERKIREREALLRSVVMNAPVSIWAVDRRARISLARGDWTFAPKPRDIVGMSVFDVFREIPQLLKDCRRALKGKECVTTAKVADAWIRFHHSPIRQEDGEVAGAVGMAVDVTELKRTEKALTHRVEMEKTIAELSSDFMRLSPDEILQGMETALERLGEFAGADRCSLFLASADRTIFQKTHEWSAQGIAPSAAKYSTRFPTQEFPWTMERLERLETVSIPSVDAIPLQGSDDRGNWQKGGVHSLVAVPLTCGLSLTGFLRLDSVKAERRWTEDDIRLFGLAGEIFSNALEREKTLTQLLQSRKLESLGVLAGGIAHDFNNVMTAILPNIQLVNMYGNLDHERRQILSRAEHASLKAVDLANQFIVFSKGGDPIKETTLISRLIPPSAELAWGDGSPISLDVILPGDLWPVAVDPRQIRQVFQNLVLNAKEAMPGGGSVQILAANIRIGRNSPLLLNQGRYLQVSIRDQGLGIAEEHIPKIFDPYFSTKKRGTQKGMGLGLAVCHSVIKKHGGLITVESKVGVGTTIRIYLPAV